MKKMFLLLSIILGGLTMVACNDVPTVEVPKEDVKTTLVKDMKDIDIEVNETYTLVNVVKKVSGMVLTSQDESIVSIKNNVLTGVKIGETNIELRVENQYQLVPVKVHEIGELGATFSFCDERLAGKKVAVYGDSVTENLTINGGKTYYDVFAQNFKMARYGNFAIGGSTAQYMYEGSNVYKEYATLDRVLDGVRMIKKAYDNNQIKDMDYVFIAYGHNDQYFQPEITAPGDEEYDVNSFDSCHSFKGSYRYMIKTLKLANPNIRIIILGCPYSEYNITNPSRFGKKYNYLDYVKAMEEVAVEQNVTYIDAWDYMYPFFDAYDNKIYYKDSVHLSETGHYELGQYICSYRDR